MSKERPYAPPRDPDEVDEDTAMMIDAPEGELDFNDPDFATDWDDLAEDEDEFEDNDLTAY